MKVKVTFVAPVLGTAPANKEIYEEFIGGKSADKDKIKEELESLSQDELAEKGKTIFHRDENGKPILYDYQVKGFIKEAFKTFVEFGPIKLPHKQKISKYTAGRVVDNHIHVEPREIPLNMPENGEITDCVRPLRAQTMRGERVSLACSEQVPKGTCITFEITLSHPPLEDTVRKALDNGEKKGIGQWRNSGMGRFLWEEIA